MRTRESYQRKWIQEKQEIIVSISCPRFMAHQALDPEMFCPKIQLQAQPCDPQKQSHSVLSCCKNPKEESSWEIPPPCENLFSKETKQSVTHARIALALLPASPFPSLPRIPDAPAGAP